jgi:hypothetical protein
MATSGITARDRMTSAWTPVVEEVVGWFASASNATMLATTEDGERVVYKPARGERPLWDFPRESLAWREVLTYRVSAALGFDLVPETAIGDGPLGPGSIQRFVKQDPAYDPLDDVRACAPRLWPCAVLDVVCNNADRKLGHILQDGAGRLHAIDHGLTFHPDDKLRTVLWGFAGLPLPDTALAALDRLRDALDGPLAGDIASALGDPSLRAFRERVARLRQSGVHPEPPNDRPPLPWPPY